MKAMKRIYFLLAIIFLFSCELPEKEIQENKSEATSLNSPPAWAKEVVWYELSVERFRNGDPSNDPTPEDIQGAYPGFVPEGWTTTPWTQDWYKLDAYVDNIGSQKDFYGNELKRFVDKAQMRRYGGDLQGVLDKVDYLHELGITAVYFRPVNDAPSLHKYDARNWRHVDVNFGPDPEGDKKIMSSEIPDDPSTWKLTSADKMFVDVIKALHEKGIRVIMDYSWNHTGKTFWAWQDILENQSKSKYKDWYWIESFDDPETPENEFSYHGWCGVPTLPEIRETEKQDLSQGLESFKGNVYSQGAKQHIFYVAERWLDPNGDGDTSDGVDGFRLDVAAEMPLGFWRDFRKHVRDINSETYFLGEIWWEEWPDKLLDPEPYLRGDIFDAVMNYRWYRSARYFFNDSPFEIPATGLIDSLNNFRSNIRDVNDYAMMNYTGGYDTPRILTSLFNKNKYKYGCKVHENEDYKIHKPDQETIDILKLLLIQQYTYIGAPHIYFGDEMGMWGADDPNCRKPLIWKDLEFEDETAHPTGKERPRDKVKFNDEIFNYHKKLISIRKANPVLIHGDIEFIFIDESKELLAYKRFNNKEEIIVGFNHEDTPKAITIPEGEYVDLISGKDIRGVKEQVGIPGRTAFVLKRKGN